MYQDIGIFAGRAHPALAQAICDYLQIPLGQIEIFDFSNENTFVRICENVRQQDVYIIQPISSPVNAHLMELFIIIDAFKRASAGRITAVMPYYAYGRSDKKDQPRVPITARLVANLLETAGANRMLTIDLHAGQIQGFFNIPVDELTALYTLGRYFKDKKELLDAVVVATDVGDARRARNMARLLNLPIAIIEKRRLGNLDRVEAVNVIGDVAGRNCLIVDDEVDTAGTLVESVRILKQHNASDVYAGCSHGILSGPAIARLQDSDLRELVITDSLPLTPDKQIDKIKVLSVAPLLGEAIHRIHTGQSVGSLFHWD